MRAPGFRVSEEYFEALSHMNLQDSSFVVKWKKCSIPIIDYSIVIDKSEDHQLNLVHEYPCIFIDDLFRKRLSIDHFKFLFYLKGYIEHEDSAVTICTHTKILGTNPKHAHFMAWDPRKGLALPRNTKSTRYILTHLADKLNFVSLHLNFQSQEGVNEN
jgi:hypothetical protein